MLQDIWSHLGTAFKPFSQNVIPSKPCKGILLDISEKGTPVLAESDMIYD